MLVLRAGPVDGAGGLHLVTFVGEDVAYMAVLGGAKLQRYLTRCLQSGLTVLLDQGEQAQAGPVAMLPDADVLAAVASRSGRWPRQCFGPSESVGLESTPCAPGVPQAGAPPQS